MSPKSASIRLVLEDELFEGVESWRRGQEKIPARVEAVRRLVEQGLASETPTPLAEQK